ncbi:MAG: ASCH domain-containing protein [Roseococcus sp.]
MKTRETDAFHAAFHAATGAADPDYDVEMFGGAPPLADDLLALVLGGRKRATAMFERDITVKGEPAPRIGGQAVVVDGQARPRAVYRTVEVRHGALDSVDDAFAWDEGEGGRTRADWLDAHRRHFARQAAREDVAMHDGIAVIFERFTLVWPSELADAHRSPA